MMTQKKTRAHQEPTRTHSLIDTLNKINLNKKIFERWYPREDKREIDIEIEK